MEKVSWGYKTRQVQYKDNLDMPFLIVGIAVILLIADMIRRNNRNKELN